MPCFVERTGFTGGQGVGQPAPIAAEPGTLYSRGRGPTADPMVVARRQDDRGRIDIPLDDVSNHITQYDPNSPYRVSWDVSAKGDENVHATNQSLSRGHEDRHKWPPGFDAS